MGEGIATLQTLFVGKGIATLQTLFVGEGIATLQTLFVGEGIATVYYQLSYHTHCCCFFIVGNIFLNVKPFKIDDKI